jgi:Tfp pilus assembly protein FimT
LWQIGLITIVFRADHDSVETHLNRPKTWNREAGISLVELTVLIVILGVIANVAIPLMGSTGNTRLRSASDLLAADLAYAQVESIAHSDDPRVLVLESDGSGYSIATVSDTTTPIINPVGGHGYAVTFGMARAARMVGVSIAAMDIGDDNELGFGQYGQLDQDTDATLTLSLNAKSITITLAADTGELAVGDLE